VGRRVQPAPRFPSLEARACEGAGAVGRGRLSLAGACGIAEGASPDPRADPAMPGLGMPGLGQAQGWQGGQHINDDCFIQYGCGAGHGYGVLGMDVGAGIGRHTFEHGSTSRAMFGVGEGSICFPDEGANYEWAPFDDMNDTNYSGFPVQGTSPVARRRRTERVPRQVTQLSGGSESEISEYEVDEEEASNTEVEELIGVKHAFRDETWSQTFFTYDPKPKEFIGRRGTSQFFSHFPTIL
jgi:hypothetical protein